MPFTRAADLPSYEQPPVHEVAVGVGFKRLSCWGSIAPGEFRQQVQERYPKMQDQAPLPPIPVTLGAGQELEFTDIPPMRRSWYLSDDERTLIQAQDNRLHVNWRRIQDGDVYPRYEHVLTEFGFALHELQSFVELRGETVAAVAGEVTYVNHIVEGALWSDWSDLSGVLADWLPVPQQASGAATLVATIGLNAMSEGGLVSPGHHMSLELKSAERRTDKSKVLVFQLTNRGAVDSTDFAALREWCGRASEDIVRGFTALTSPRAHEYWRRTR